jgi:hypothetical protein
MKKVTPLALFLVFVGLALGAAEKKIVFVAGPPSHGRGDHEHRAGCLLLKSCLDGFPGVASAVYSNGWPADPAAAFAGASTVVLYSDGGGGHPFLQGERRKVIEDLARKGVGLAFLHYAVEATPETEGLFQEWIGGCFAINWSVNPTWNASFKEFPDHPAARGLKPFKLNDEWYFHMRFPTTMKGVTPILTAVPPESTMRRADGPHEGNPAVRGAVKRGDPQHLAWCFERPDGSRGFGFTGGHFHKNWGDENFRKTVLNAILWTAKIEVPAEGYAGTVTPELLAQGLDPK